MNKIAIIGFGGAGYCAAKAVRSCDANAQIDVYSDSGLAPYNPMLTTYYVKGAIPYDALFPFGKLETIREKLKLNLVEAVRVVELNGSEKKLSLSNGKVEAYDNILISTGASAVMPPLQGIDLPGVFKMRTAQDAVRLKKMLNEGKIKRGLVIGASWVGIKVVEDFCAKNIACTLVDGAGWIFPTASFRETAQRIHKDLENKGVALAFDQMLDHIEKETDGQLTAVMKSGRTFTADAIAVCIGVRPNIAFLKDSGIEMGRGIFVDERMQTNLPGIYAAGDCCEAIEVQSGKHLNIGVWMNAQNQGEIAGYNMAGVRKEFGGNILLNLAHYMNYDFVSIGDMSACNAEDTVYEYEDDMYYIRAVKGENGVKCINLIGSAESNGVLKHILIKAFENPTADIDLKSICLLKSKGFPDSFIDFIGGTSID